LRISLSPSGATSAARGTRLNHQAQRSLPGRVRSLAGEREPGQITAAQIELGFLACWHDDFEHRNGGPPKPRTTRNMISQLRTLYAFADRFDLLIGPDGQPVRNPMAKVDPPKVKRVIKDWLERGECSWRCRWG
jgi:hypothetical protein